MRFLRYFIMANYQFEMERSGGNDAVVREDEIYSWFTNKENTMLCGYQEKPFEFIRQIIRSTEHYLNFRDGKDNQGNPSPAMDELRTMTGGAFSLHYVLLLAVSPLPAPLFNHFVKQLESFLFFYIFTKTTTKQLEKDFSVWADELRGICRVVDDVEQQFNEFVQSKFAVGMKKLEGQLEDALKRYSLTSMQKYRSNYLLAKITREVEAAFQGAPQSLRNFTGLQVEHILPNKPSAELRSAFDTTNPETSYDEQKNRLGNLNLLEKPHNIVAGNDFYQVKQGLYDKSGNYLTRSLVKLTDVGNNSSVTRINEKLQSFDEWTAESIDQRREMLHLLIRDIWKTWDVEV